MKLFKKVLAGVAVAAALATSAQASVITVGGISWDPDSLYPDFGAGALAIHQDINQTTGEVTGYGVIKSFNGVDLAAATELTMVFGGFVPNVPNFIPSTGSLNVAYTGGWVKLYSDSLSNAATLHVSNRSDIGTVNYANAGDGDLWLSLVVNAGNPFIGNIYNTTLAQGGGSLDVVGGGLGGLAASNFDTNTMIAGSDITFTNTFGRNVFAANGQLLSSNGVGDMYGNSIPEPESLALVGLGLLGLAASRRRKSVK
jgi:hypothetical protein